MSHLRTEEFVEQLMGESESSKGREKKIIYAMVSKVDKALGVEADKIILTDEERQDAEELVDKISRGEDLDMEVGQRLSKISNSRQQLALSDAGMRLKKLKDNIASGIYKSKAMSMDELSDSNFLHLCAFLNKVPEEQMHTISDSGIQTTLEVFRNPALLREQSAALLEQIREEKGELTVAVYKDTFTRVQNETYPKATEYWKSWEQLKDRIQTTVAN